MEAGDELKERVRTEVVRELYELTVAQMRGLVSTHLLTSRGEVKDSRPSPHKSCSRRGSPLRPSIA